MNNEDKNRLLLKIRELENRIEESDHLIEAIKAGEVDAFAINNNHEPEIFTLQSGDYAYRVLIEEFEEGALNVTEEGLIVYTNPYFFRLLQIPYEQVVSTSIFAFIHPDSLHEFNRLFKESIAGKKSKGEINLMANGTKVPVYISLTSLQPKLATVGIIITDFTEKKKHEELILEYQRNLEFKNKELVQSNTELASFAYIASHDLQEPLRKIQTFAAHIVEKEFVNLSDQGRNHFVRIKRAAKRMQTLIEDLLMYSRTNTVERRFVISDLGKIVDEVIEDLKEELQQKEAVIEVGELGSAPVIPFQFRQLINNLLNNSLKFSIPGTPPHIKIQGDSVTSDEVKSSSENGTVYRHLSVADNGIGFEQQYSEKIFDLFQRLHGRTEYKGSGIGLAIVKKIVDNHNGFVTVNSELNKGATFNLYFPVY